MQCLKFYIYKAINGSDGLIIGFEPVTVIMRGLYFIFHSISVVKIVLVIAHSHP